jgi:integrase
LKLGYYRPKKGDGSWVARLWVAELNRPRQQSTLGTADDHAEANGGTRLSYSQAQEKARQWKTQALSAASGEDIQSGPFTVEAAWKAYRRDCERRGMKSLGRTEGQVKLHILPTLGRVEVAKLTQGRIERWHENMANSAARVRTKFGAKEQATRADPKTDDEKRARKDTANRVLTILKAALNYAKRRRLTAATGDAWREAKPFRDTTSSRVRFLNTDESQRLVNVCPPDFRRLVQGALFTGARFGELVRLQVRDFENREHGTVHIVESKSGKDRHVVLTAEGTSFFQEITTGKSSDTLLFRRDVVDRRSRTKLDDPFSWQRGDQHRIMAAVCKAAGLGSLTFHELRHSYASSLVNAGVPLAFIAQQLGHAGTRMVEQHYGHLAQSAMAEAIRKLAPKLGIHTPGNVAGLEIKKA